MSNLAQDDPSVWEMRQSDEPISQSVEPISSDEHDLFGAARGILWWTLVSSLFWCLLGFAILAR